ncbi:MAG: VWA domain-containing protein [Arenicellales bacterium]
MPENFHFLQPQWFYLLLPLAAVIWLLLRQGAGTNDAWQKIIDKNLLAWLRVSRAGSSNRLPLWLLSAGWCVAVIALANPVWEKLPQPVFQTDQARVIVLDLSRSMNSSDFKPSRLERARFKVSDILEQQQEGVIGLVVFAGDAFVVSPLTRDADTISAMLPALKPGIMPVQGSRADLALLKAAELLQQAGRMRGEILLLADSYTDDRTIEAAEKLRQQGFITSVLGIGTELGAPLPTGQGGFFTNNDGDVITTRLDVPAMKELAKAGGGHYVSLSANDTDITRLMQTRVKGSRSRAENDTFETARWKETGPWLVILLLPLAALAFRRGWLLSVCLIVMTAIPNEPAMAFSMTDLWQRQDQQAHKALLEGEVERASELAKDPLRKGVAEFRKGDFEAAVEDFSFSDSAEAAYNKGNALAKLGKLQQAIDAYDQALKEQPGMQDAEYNREAVEKLLQQQSQQDQQDKQDDKNQQGDQDKDNQDKDNQQGDQDQEDKDKQQGEKGQQGKESESSEGGQEQQAEDKANAFSDAAEQARKDAESEEAEQQEEQAAKPQEGNDSEKGTEEDQQSEAQSAEVQPGENDDQQENGRATAEAEDLSSEEQIAAEQWLRRIPDDPAGLLRRKLRYQYIQRGGGSGKAADPQPW